MTDIIQEVFTPSFKYLSDIRKFIQTKIWHLILSRCLCVVLGLIQVPLFMTCVGPYVALRYAVSKNLRCRPVVGLLRCETAICFFLPVCRNGKKKVPKDRSSDVESGELLEVLVQPDDYQQKGREEEINGLRATVHQLEKEKHELATEGRKEKQQLQAGLKKLKKEIHNLTTQGDKENQQLQARLEKLGKEKHNQITEKEKENQQLQARLKKLEKEKHNLTTELMSAKIKRDTDRFQNLMDDARPEKVVELFDPVYNYERLDALDAFEAAGMSTEKADALALQIIMTAHERSAACFGRLVKEVAGVVARGPRNPDKFGDPDKSGDHDKSGDPDKSGDQDKSGDHNERLYPELPEGTTDLEVPQDLEFNLKLMLKQNWKEADLSLMIREIIETLERNSPILRHCEKEEAVKEYLASCARVSWVMVLQTPAMTFAVPQLRAPFDGKTQKAASTCKVTQDSRVVSALWPALVGKTTAVTLVKAVVKV